MSKETKIIAFATQKGGVGKTMTCWHTIGVLAKEGKRILAIDVDAQANLTSNFGFDNTEFYQPNNMPYGTCQIFRSAGAGRVVDPADININSVIIKSPLDIMPTVDLIPSHIFLSVVDNTLGQVSFKEKILQTFLEYYEDIMGEYDYILIDTAPNMFPINQNAFLTSDSIILISDPSIHSIDGMEVFIEQWKQISKVAKIDFNIKAVLLNNVDGRTTQKEDFYGFCQEHEELQALLLDTFVPQAIALRQSETDCTPIIFNKDSKVKHLQEVYNKIVEELKTKEVL